ncbi:MAG: efflux RND transporter permease subunit [Puia sp.]
MNISELSLKRPVLATVMNLMIILFGIVGFNFLAVRDYPAIDPPIINVSTSYTGANPDIIESQITEPLEKTDQWYSRYPNHFFHQFTGK